jgi:RHS repeat-associated protein
LHGDGFDQTFARVDLRAANASERVLWYLTDHLNSVRLVLDETGAVLDQIAYDAFGNIVAQLNPLLVNPILFASREFDAETGLYYNRARYLDPTTGRWTTQDPLGFAAGDANLYRYVGNMATMATDPSGNIAFVLFVVAGAIAGWWLLGPGAGTAHAPSPGQENIRTPPRPLAEDVLAGISGAIAGGGAALAGEAAVVAGGQILRRLRPTAAPHPQGGNAAARLPNLQGNESG